MQNLVKLKIVSLYGVRIGKDINQSYKCESQNWMETEYDDKVLGYWRLADQNHIVKFKKDDGLEGHNDAKNTLPSYLGAFILSNIEQIMNDFIGGKNEFYKISIYCSDTDSLYIEKKHWGVLDKTYLVGSSLWQCENDYKSGGNFFVLFVAPKKIV